MCPICAFILALHCEDYDESKFETSQDLLGQEILFFDKT